MKIGFIITVLIIITVFSGCFDLSAPSVSGNLYEYKVYGYEGASADILYRDGDNQIVEILTQELPWSVEFIPGENFTGMLSIKADISQSEVFSYFKTGNANNDIKTKLVDSTADFINDGVVAGDVIYSNLDSLVSARVLSVDSATTLSLNTDFFENGNEPYYIFHLKKLTVELIEDGVLLDYSTQESEKKLSVIVMESVSR